MSPTTTCRSLSMIATRTRDHRYTDRGAATNSRGPTRAAWELQARGLIGRPHARKPDLHHSHRHPGAIASAADRAPKCPARGRVRSLLATEAGALERQRERLHPAARAL